MKYLRLGNVCEINPKTKEISQLDEEAEVSFLPMAAVSEEGKLNFTESRKLREVKKGYTFFKENDVLVAKITPCMENGKRLLVGKLINGVGFGSTEFHVLRPKKSVTSEWIYFFISQPSFRDNAKKNMTGTAGQKRVPKRYLSNLEIPVPSLKTQQRLTEILQMADNLKEKRKKANQMANKMVQSVFFKIFGNLFEPNVKFKTAQIGDVAQLQGGFAFKSRDFSSKGIKLAKITNVHYGSLDWSKSSKLPYDFSEKYSEFLLRENDIVMAMTRPIIKSLKSVKVVKVKKDDLPCLLNQRVGRFIIDTKAIDPTFLLSILYSPYFFSEISKLSAVSLQPNVSSDQIEAIKIPLPPMELQRQFAKITSKIENLGKHQHKSEINVVKLFDSLSLKIYKSSLLKG